MPLVSKTFDQLLDFTRTSAATFVGSNGLIQNTAASRNLLLQTQQFDNAAWPKTALTATANTVTAPDGTSTADTLTDTVATSNHYAAQTITTTAATTYTMSAYVKNNGRGFVILNLANLSGATNYAAVSFNLSTGAVVNTLANGTGYSVSSSSITSVGDGWYRCTMTAVVGSTTATTASVALSSAGTIGAYGLDSYLGNGSGIYIWGAQLEVVPAANLVLGSELVTNGTFAGGSTTGWTAAGSATISGTGDVLTVTNGATAFGYAVTSITTIVGRTYYVTYQVTGGTSTGNLYIGTASGGFENYAGPNQGVGSYTVAFVATATTTFVRLGNSVNTSGATFIVDNISTKEITAITGMPSTYTRNNGGVFPPRFDYDPITLAPKGLLVEEQRTNLALQSQTFDSATWNKFGTTVTANAAVSPGGVADADALVEDGTTGSHICQQFLSYTSGTAYTFSLYVKAGTRTWVSFGLPVAAFGAAQGGFYNLSGAGALGAAIGTPTARTITAVGNGWYRITVTATATATAGGNTVIAAASADGSSSYTGVAGAEALYLYGAQLEAGAFATSYIPTVASQVTRTADQTSIVAPNFAPWYNQSEGTIVVEVSSIPVAGRSIYSVDNGTAGARILAQSQNAATDTAFRIVDTTDQANIIQATGGAAGAIVKMASAYKVNDFATSNNGAAVGTDTSGTVPTGLNTLRIGQNVAGVAQLCGHIRSVRYYPVRLSNAQIQALTA